MTIISETEKTDMSGLGAKANRHLWGHFARHGEGITPTIITHGEGVHIWDSNGNRYIAMAVQTSAPVPFSQPGRNCQKVAFRGGRLRCLIEVVDTPQIDGTHTLGVHRVIQTVVQGKPRSGEL